MHIDIHALRLTPYLRRPCLQLALLLGVLWLAGCVSQPEQPTRPSPALPEVPSITQEWQRYQQMLGAIGQWQAQGKLGIRMPDQSGSAHFNWQQQTEQFAVLLNGPLGQGATWIRSDGRRVTLEQAGQATIEAATPEALMLDTLGWWLPVSELRYWIKGIPAPDSAIIDEQHNDDGTLMLLQQNGWLINYSRYQQQDGWHLPAKVVAQYPANNRADGSNNEAEGSNNRAEGSNNQAEGSNNRAEGSNRDIRLTFIVKDWQLHQHTP